MTGFPSLDRESEAAVVTPAFIYDERKILARIGLLKKRVPVELCTVLFPLKCFSIYDGLRAIAGATDGFSVSSLFEAKLARHLGQNKPIHLTTPGLKREEMPSLFSLCNYISFNSISQFEAAAHIDGSGNSRGLRINPQLSFVRDKRYNPCRKQSKLGVPLAVLVEELNALSSLRGRVEGVHFHSNCESSDFRELVATVNKIESEAAGLLEELKWINLGGGYLFDESSDLDEFVKLAWHLRRRYDLRLFFEPGKALVADAGYIVSSVVDLFQSDGDSIAVLDTTVNHMPEVFEYQFKPSVTQEQRTGKYRYILAGCTCLSGDLFGTYRFAEPLTIGSRATFANMGAYTMVKANMFNGVNLPTIYRIDQKGSPELSASFGYQDYISRCGVHNVFT
jgi:carboxynorspermidine decarboxylase